MVKVRPKMNTNRNDFTNEDPWRIFRIMAEFVEGFETLSAMGKAVSIFGSARLTANHKYYRFTEEVAYLLAKDGYAIVTGGGPGLMEAGNRGARRARGYSIGLNIHIPLEQKQIRMSIRCWISAIFLCARSCSSNTPRHSSSCQEGMAHLMSLQRH